MNEKIIAIAIIILSMGVPALVFTGAYYAGRYSKKIKTKIKWKYSDSLFEFVVVVGCASIVMGYFCLLYITLRN